MRIFVVEKDLNISIMPEISKFYGIIIYMYIDDHNPPHFHVWYDDYQAEITIKESRSYLLAMSSEEAVE